MNPECACELKEPEEYTDDELLNESYFERLEDDESFEWYIHREDTCNIELNDYQRIVPRNFLSVLSISTSSHPSVDYFGYYHNHGCSETISKHTVKTGNQ